MDILRRTKNTIMNVMPSRVLFEIKRIYYFYSLKKFSEKNEPDFKIVKYIIKPGDNVVDLGANIGWYTKMLSDLVGDQGHVYSVEPLPITFKLLSSCTKKLKLKNVTLLNYGISNMESSAIIEVPKYDRGGDNYYRAKIVSEENIDPFLKHDEIIVKPLDSLFIGLTNRISFIKCDVEGHELAVIKSAKKVLTIFKPIWLIEVSGNPDIKDSNAFKLFSIIEKEGYKAYWFDGKNLKRRSFGDISTNYFFMTENHISSILFKKNDFPIET
jgi:FkbM family methyltransferase